MPPFLKYEWEEGEQKNVLPPYDFSVALALPVTERFEQSVAILQQHAQAEAAIVGEDLLPLQPGFSEDQITEMEQVQKAPFAPEVKDFLRHWKRGGGMSGISFYGPDCWVEDELAAKGSFLMIGDYWRYADGDQLVMPLSSATEKVFLYLHEHGPKIEEFAPSFSLALWRMVHETF